MDESFRYFECTAVYADIFANAEDSGISLHLFPNAFADCFEVSVHISCWLPARGGRSLSDWSSKVCDIACGDKLLFLRLLYFWSAVQKWDFSIVVAEDALCGS